MALVGLFGNGVGEKTALAEMLMCPEIQPGSSPSYQICKTIYSYHPLGKKMVDTPIAMAQSQQREITIASGPEDRIRDAFLAEWKTLRANKVIANFVRISRIYGISSLAIVVDKADSREPLDFKNLWKEQISLNVLDPLNTSGSNVTPSNQNPNALDFQRTAKVSVAGVPYHTSRTCVLMNEAPLYIEYTSSSYGYVGRSVYQRALFPLKSFVQTMRTDDLVTRKVGVIIAKIKQVGSMVDNVMSRIVGGKRELAREAITDDVMSIGDEDSVESLNLQNLEGPYGMARKNIIENLALSADMPAKILNSETFAEGFGEGTEDAKSVAGYVDGVREDMQPAYDFMDLVVQYRAWTPAFYETLQADFPEEYAGVDFDTAFCRWTNGFKATWPSLIREPDSEKIKVNDVQLKAIIALVQVLMPQMDPENKVTLIQWAADNFNDLKLLFPTVLTLDYDALASYVPPQPEGAPGEPAEPKPFSAADSAEWNEGDHPRAKDGKFGSGGGSAAKSPEKESPAASLYEKHAKNAPKTEAERVKRGAELAEAGGASEHVARAREKLAHGVATDAPVDRGGHVQPNGQYTPARRELHRKLLNEIFTAEAIERAMPEEGQKPIMTMLGGRGGSGKSWLTGEHGPAIKNSITVDADHFKGELPEYEGWNAGLLHEESSYLVDRAAKRAARLGVNVTFDATLKSSRAAENRIAQFEQAGHEIHGFYMFASPEEATKRAIGRLKSGQEKTGKGRFVPPEVVMGNTENEKNFDAAIPKFKKWGVYDNMGSAPRHVASGTNE